MPKYRFADAELEHELNVLRYRLKHIEDAIRSIEALAQVSEKDRPAGSARRHLHRTDDFRREFYGGRPAKR